MRFSPFCPAHRPASFCPPGEFAPKNGATGFSPQNCCAAATRPGKGHDRACHGKRWQLILFALSLIWRKCRGEGEEHFVAVWHGCARMNEFPARFRCFRRRMLRCGYAPFSFGREDGSTSERSRRITSAARWTWPMMSSRPDASRAVSTELCPSAKCRAPTA